MAFLMLKQTIPFSYLEQETIKKMVVTPKLHVREIQLQVLVKL